MPVQRVIAKMLLIAKSVQLNVNKGHVSKRSLTNDDPFCPPDACSSPKAAYQRGMDGLSMLSDVIPSNNSSFNASEGHTGTEFVLMFMPYYNDTKFAQMIITSDVRDVAPKIDIQSQFPGSFQTTYSAHDVSIVSLPPSILDLSDGSNLNGIQVRADHPISVVGILGLGPYSTAAFSAIPTDKLGRSYLLATQKTFYSDKQTVGIVALFDNTDVRINLSNKSDIFLISSNTTINAGNNFTITLSYLETFYFETEDDITGTLIESDKDVAVYDGIKRTGRMYLYDVKKYTNSLRTLAIEQLQPLSTQRREFIIPHFRYSSKISVRSVSFVPYSKIYTYYSDVYTVYHDEYINKIDIGSKQLPFSLASKEAFQVTLYVSMHHNLRSSFFTVSVPSLAQFSNNYVLSAPFLNITYENFVSIIIKSRDIDGLLFDDHPVTFLDVKEIIYENQLFKTLTLRLSPIRSHILRHKSQDVIFGAIVYGVGDGWAYGYPAGLR